MGGPVVKDAHIEARITVKKTGDPTKRSKVRVYTLDGSAKAGKGYQPITKVRRTFPFVKLVLGTSNIKVINNSQNLRFEDTIIQFCFLIRASIV